MRYSRSCIFFPWNLGLLSSLQHNGALAILNPQTGPSNESKFLARHLGRKLSAASAPQEGLFYLLTLLRLRILAHDLSIVSWLCFHIDTWDFLSEIESVLELFLEKDEVKFVFRVNIWVTLIATDSISHSTSSTPNLSMWTHLASAFRKRQLFVVNLEVCAGNSKLGVVEGRSRYRSWSESKQPGEAEQRHWETK